VEIGTVSPEPAQYQIKPAQTGSNRLKLAQTGSNWLKLTKTGAPNLLFLQKLSLKKNFVLMLIVDYCTGYTKLKEVMSPLTHSQPSPISFNTQS